MVDPVVKPRITQTDLVPGCVKPRHLEQGLAAVKFSTSENLPDVGDTYPVFFALDTNVLSIWNGTSWVSVTLT